HHHRSSTPPALWNTEANWQEQRGPGLPCVAHSAEVETGGRDKVHIRKYACALHSGAAGDLGPGNISRAQSIGAPFVRYRKIREPGFAGCARAEVEEGGQNKVAIRDAVTPGVIWIYRPDVLADGCPRTSCFVHRARFIAGRSHLNIYHFGQLTASLGAAFCKTPPLGQTAAAAVRSSVFKYVHDNLDKQFQIWEAPMAFTVPKNGQCSDPRVEPVADALGMRRQQFPSRPLQWRLLVSRTQSGTHCASVLEGQATA
ncbi:hypothetical protein OH76DRAFT_1424262, partial [Lentinus brumalis]